MLGRDSGQEWLHWKQLYNREQGAAEGNRGREVKLNEKIHIYIDMKQKDEA